MQPIDKKKQQNLISSLILNFFGLLFIGILVFTYILPTYAIIWEKISNIDQVYADFQKKQADGVSVDSFFALASRYAKVTFTEDDKKNSKDIEEIMKKTDSNLTYLEWVEKELKKKTENELELEKNDKIIAGIIPTYSELTLEDTLFDKNRITLKDIVFYVENNILKKFELTSYSAVGFSGLSFEKQKWSSINIGSYVIPMELSGTNKNLIAFINSIQKSGQIVIEDGKLKAPKDLDGLPFSNLLVSINQLTFADSFEKPDKENKISIELVFYARAKSFTDLLKITQRLAETTTEMKKTVDKYVNMCSNLTDPVCKNENSLKSIQAIRAIVEPVKQLDTQLQVSLKSTTTQDVTTEFNKIATITTTLNSLKETFERNKAIIEQFTTNTTSKKAENSK